MNNNHKSQYWISLSFSLPNIIWYVHVFNSNVFYKIIDYVISYLMQLCQSFCSSIFLGSGFLQQFCLNLPNFGNWPVNVLITFPFLRFLGTDSFFVDDKTESFIIFNSISKSKIMKEIVPICGSNINRYLNNSFLRCISEFILY